MNHPVVEALGWSLIHSLWECSVVALVFAAFHLFVRRVNARYIAGCIAMLLMLAGPVATFVSLFEQAESTTALAAAGASAFQEALQHTADAVPIPSPLAMPSFLAITVWVWLSGVIAMSVYSAAGWVSAQRLKRCNQAVPEVWQRRLTALAAQLHIHRAIRLYASARAQVPAVIGWLRPVILVPAAALMNLSAEELEAVLAHELAHVRRYDYLVNLIQTAVETLLFYHPAVWWVGRRIRVEREHCCDDLAVRACGDRLVYARALTSLEELRSGSPQFAMAVTGGEFSGRIRRLFGARQPAGRVLPFWLIAAFPLLLSTAGLVNSWAARADRPPQPSPATTPIISPAPVMASPAIAPADAVTPVQHAQATTPPPRTAIAAPQAAPARHGEGYLAGLADAGYTNISVDEIIELKQNGVPAEYIKGMLQAGFGVLSPKELIKLRNNGVPPEYVRAVKSSGMRDADIDGVVRLRQNGVRPDLIEALSAAGYKDVTVAQVIQAQAYGLSGASLRSLREQGFKNLTLDQVMKLKRAGVI